MNWKVLRWKRLWHKLWYCHTMYLERLKKAQTSSVTAGIFLGLRFVPETSRKWVLLFQTRPSAISPVTIFMLTTYYIYIYYICTICFQIGVKKYEYLLLVPPAQSFLVADPVGTHHVWGVCVTNITGYGLDNWIYWHFLHNYNPL
jgi:hypothetical protein